VRANRLFAEKFPYPLHIGITEAGPLIPGIVRSTIAFTDLLREDIGNTVRVSLSDSPESEIITAREILSALGKRRGGARIVSCPRCGRSGFNVHGFLEKLGDRLHTEKKEITVAVMGCVVNGPGEAKHADLGITGSGNKVIIFKHGEIVRTVTEDEAYGAFLEELDKL
jgi:(E)-4-hydroxy-3-methylbut-2-enyl-diphosphate synthase